MTRDPVFCERFGPDGRPMGGKFIRVNGRGVLSRIEHRARREAVKASVDYQLKRLAATRAFMALIPGGTTSLRAGDAPASASHEMSAVMGALPKGKPDGP